MEAVEQNMLQALTLGNKRVCAVDENMLLCTEDIPVHEAPYEAPWDILEVHKEACKSICSMALILHHSNAVPHLHTYANVYLMWYACMRAAFDEENLQPEHRKYAFAEYIRGIPSRKLTVILPAVCFWVSVKCNETFSLTTREWARMVDAVHKGRGDDRLVEYNLHDLRDTEHAVLQLLDFDILKNQETIDVMEKTIRAQFGEAYESVEAQGEIVRIVCRMFQGVAIDMN
jgi:hypothetical protein